ncbi:MAG: glycosyl hydrolase [Bacteroidetes bacterium]|nr:MAG: glycosyl hydrolase [Bacteroidota bacterium]
MSYRPEKTLSLSGVNYENKTAEQISDLFSQVLENGMHGLCFSAYVEGQKPGDTLSEAQIRRRMAIIAPYTKWIRSFSCIEGNELIPQIAKEFGLKTLVGAWLGSDKEKNEEEINALIDLADKGFVDIAAVGNEVLYRNDLSEEELLDYINRVKQAIPNVPVGYVDAYYEFSACPRITDACDVILANCYPFWEGCHMDYSLVYMKQMFNQAINAGNGKKVIITETGWPSEGSNCKAAEPSKEAAIKYFINAQKWSAEEDVEIFYFTSFDESWKVGSEGDVGAYWGLWDKDEHLKF